jgi:DNA-directed RNA polymerase subunit alpha
MISLPQKPKIIATKDNQATFVIEGLYPGYGVTIGNSLRRVLLSSLEGAAVTEAKIKGALHEFSTMPGILEDVLTICLNLKQMRFKMHTPEPQKAFLKVKGEKKVKAGEFKLPPQLELINKDIIIATLTDKKSELEMEIKIEKGFGYEEAGQRRKEKLAAGELSIDAIFTPLRRVAFRVENMRVGDRTDYDRLFLDVETDGTITAKEAFLKSSDILLKHFSLFAESFEEPKDKEVEKKKAPTKKEVKTKEKIAKKSKSKSKK